MHVHVAKAGKNNISFIVKMGILHRGKKAVYVHGVFLCKRYYLCFKFHKNPSQINKKSLPKGKDTVIFRTVFFGHKKHFLPAKTTY